MSKNIRYSSTQIARPNYPSDEGAYVPTYARCTSCETAQGFGHSQEQAREDLESRHDLAACASATHVDRFAPDGYNRVAVIGDSSFEDAVRVKYADSGIESTVLLKHLTKIETHTVELWSVNFRGQRVVSTEYAGTLDECRDVLAWNRSRPGAGWGYSEAHVAIRRLSDDRVIEHTGRKGFNHGRRSALVA